MGCGLTPLSLLYFNINKKCQVVSKIYRRYHVFITKYSSKANIISDDQITWHRITQSYLVAVAFSDKVEFKPTITPTVRAVTWNRSYRFCSIAEETYLLMTATIAFSRRSPTTFKTTVKVCDETVDVIHQLG